MTFTETETGLISSVEAVPAGAYIFNDQAAATTVIAVDDSADFDEDGGVLVVNSDDGTGTISAILYTYTAVDKDLDLITLTTGLTYAAVDGDFVGLSPDATEKRAVVMIGDGNEAITANVPHQLNDLINEGVRDEGARESVTLELKDGDWWISDMPGQTPSLQSSTFDDGVAGWGLDDNSAQFDSVSVINDLAASRLSVDSIQLGDSDLGTLITDNTGGGVVGQTSTASGTVNSALISTVNTICAVYSQGDMIGGRFYQINYGCAVLGTVAGDVFIVRIYKTEDGTTPTTSSPGGIMDGSSRNFILAAGQNASIDSVFWYTPASDFDVVKFGLALQRASGTGTGAMQFTNANQPVYFEVTDLGIAPSSQPISQKSVSSGSPAPDPVSTTTTIFYSTNSQSYDGNSAQRLGDTNTSYCYQGYYSSTHGNTASAVLFDSATIRTKLTGATVNSISLVFRVAHAYYFSGLNVRIGSHNFSSLPSTYGGPSGTLASQNGATEGSTYTVTLPTSFGTDLKNGVERGISFYGPSTDRHYYGYLYGGTSAASRPRLHITYTK